MEILSHTVPLLLKNTSCRHHPHSHPLNYPITHILALSSPVLSSFYRDPTIRLCWTFLKVATQRLSFPLSHPLSNFPSFSPSVQLSLFLSFSHYNPTPYSPIFPSIRLCWTYLKDETQRQDCRKWVWLLELTQQISSTRDCIWPCGRKPKVFTPYHNTLFHTHPFIHTLSCALFRTQPLTHPLAHPLTHPLTHSHPPSTTSSYTPSPQHTTKGHNEQSTRYINDALRSGYGRTSNDYMVSLAKVHAKLRSTSSLP